jgi:diguanylate cyclase (GGDEF)-like protein
MENATKASLMDEIYQREAISRVLTSTGRTLLASANCQESLPVILPPLGAALGVSSVYVFKAIRNGGITQTPKLVYEWIHHDPAPRRVIPGQAEDDLGRVFAPPGGLPVEELVFKGRVSELPFLERQYFHGKGVESFLVIPIYAGKEWWGILAFGDTSTRRVWSAVEEDSLELVANLLGAALENQQINAELHDLYTTEKEKHQFARTLGEISTTLDSTLDFEQVLDMLLDEILRVVPYDTACVILLDGDTARIARWRGYDRFIKGDLKTALSEVLSVEKSANIKTMMTTGEPMIIADTRDEPTWGKMETSLHIRSWCGAPIFIRGKMVAFLSLDKVEPGFYNEKHAHLLEAFTGQAALALQNAKSFADMQDSLQRERVLNETALLISSALELPTILQSVSRLTAQLMKVDVCLLSVLDEEGQRFEYEYGYNIPGEPGETVLLETGLEMETINTGKSLLLEDYKVHPLAKQAWVDAGARSFICVPLRMGEDKLGVLTLISTRPDVKLNQLDLELIESVGRQIAVAIKNTRLFTAVQRRAREADTLRIAASAITSSMSLKDVTQAIQEQIARVVPCDSSALFLVNGDNIYIASTSGKMANSSIIGNEYPLDEELFLEILKSNNPLIIPDVREDRRFKNWGNAPLRCWMAVPLLARDQLVGFITLDNRIPGIYTPVDAKLVRVFADEAAVAVENARLFESLQQMAVTDSLTGIHNRRAFFDMGEHEYQRTLRYKNELSVIMMDIDSFKKVNDTNGHKVGDQVLREVASRFQAGLRDTDILARYGGEEFIILLPQTGHEKALQAACRVSHAVKKAPIPVGEQSIRITISVGFTSLEEDSQTLEEMIHHADLAMYGAKTAGRGSICGWVNGEIKLFEGDECQAAA